MCFFGVIQVGLLRPLACFCCVPFKSSPYLFTFITHTNARCIRYVVGQHLLMGDQGLEEEAMLRKVRFATHAVGPCCTRWVSPMLMVPEYCVHVLPLPLLLFLLTCHEVGIIPHLAPPTWLSVLYREVGDNCSHSQLSSKI